MTLIKEKKIDNAFIESDKTIPLCVDLDGTLIFSDMLHEATVKTIRNNIVSLFKIPYWLYQGKAILKKKLASLSNVNPVALPYNENFLSWLSEEKQKGRPLVLCTASDQQQADAISNHLGIFDEVIASNGETNMAGKNKADALVEKYGEKGFDYAGNSSVDIHVWSRARNAIIVNASAHTIVATSHQCAIEEIFPANRVTVSTILRMLRIHQWLKNILLFIPLFAAHRLMEPETWFNLLIAFVCFSLCASSVYIANDILDLESDRLHPRKKKRPFASGAIPVWKGVIIAPLLLAGSLLLATLVNGNFIPWLIVYFVITCLYSVKLKQVVLIDCVTLAALYTLRIVAGAAAAEMSLSFWLLAFSGFLFLSLAFVKRFAELQTQLLQGKHKAHGRGYFTDDAPLIEILGICSGFSSVVVLALYLNSDEVLKLYTLPEWGLGSVPVMLFWVSWMWLRAHRGEMHDDPLIFAVKDKTSLCAGIVFGLFLLMGTIGNIW